MIHIHRCRSHCTDGRQTTDRFQQPMKQVAAALAVEFWWDYTTKYPTLLHKSTMGWIIGSPRCAFQHLPDLATVGSSLSLPVTYLAGADLGIPRELNLNPPGSVFWLAGNPPALSITGVGQCVRLPKRPGQSVCRTSQSVRHRSRSVRPKRQTSQAKPARAVELKFLRDLHLNRAKILNKDPRSYN